MAVSAWIFIGTLAVAGLLAYLLSRHGSESKSSATTSIAARIVHGATGRPTGGRSIDIKFARMEAGAFFMGSPPSELGHDETESIHQVTLTRPFRMGVVPVTQAQFARFVAATKYRTSAEVRGFSFVRWKGKKGANWRTITGENSSSLPVVHVSWNDAVAFCNWATRESGTLIRLPTEAEWEYACRAGTTTRFAGTGNLDEMGWYGGNSGRSPLDCDALRKKGMTVYFNEIAANGCQRHPVGLKLPNAWGLYDMHGNVWEWCFDAYGKYPQSHVIDPTGPAEINPAWRTMRGGTWDQSARICRSANRGNFRQGDSYDIGGFRVVQEI